MGEALGASILVVYGIVVVAGLAILFAILRWALGITKITQLLEVIAQEVRLANAVNLMDARLKKAGMNQTVADYLNKLRVKNYEPIDPKTEKPEEPTPSPG